MKLIKREYLTVHQARELEHMGFIVKYVTFTRNGMLFDIYVI